VPAEHPHVQLIRDFHDAQNRFYAGGDQGATRAMLTEDVRWHVPGRSPICGDYRGRDQVLQYFAARRQRAHGTIRIEVHGVLADAQRAVILAGAQLEDDGASPSWSTVVVFRLAEGRIAECWVLPYDQDAFDDVWL
jgi:hypothetical protein